jgi:hypothetical protein
MPAPAQEPPHADLPAFEEAGQRVIRFGSGAALVILVVLAAFAALALGFVPLNQFGFERTLTPSPLPLRSDAGRATGPVGVPAGKSGVDIPADADALWNAAPTGEAQAERIDAAFKTLDTSDIAGMRRFLEIYGDSVHAANRGYLEKVRGALRDAEAGAREAARALEAEEQEEEQRRREQQQAVPWDMGVVPPSPAQ